MLYPGRFSHKSNGEDFSVLTQEKNTIVSFPRGEDVLFLSTSVSHHLIGISLRFSRAGGIPEITMRFSLLNEDTETDDDPKLVTTTLFYW